MLLTFLQGAADALWGTSMTVVLVGMGLYLSLRFRFYYNFRHWGFHFRNTFGKMFQKGEGHGTVSGFAAACTAMANTIGVGPYGAYLADGSEYRGHYGVSREDLEKFHRRRAELLWQAGADVLLFETQPSLEEALVEASIAKDLGAAFWVSFSCRDGLHICEGTPIREAAAEVARQFPEVEALGVNCTKPEYLVSLIGELKTASDRPIFVYPNSGEEYDPVTKTWHGVGTDRKFGDYALEYMKAGAVAVGGCCTTVADHVRQVAAAREQFLGEA